MSRFSFLIILSTFLSTFSQADFKFRINEDLGTLDWGYGEVNYVVVQQLMDGLTGSGERGEALPAIAQSWKTISGKNAAIEFKLREDARWSDGTPVCAQHFIDAWLRVLSPKFASPYAHYLFDIRNARAYHSTKLSDSKQVGLIAQGCSKLRIELERPIGYFADLVSHWVFLPIRLDLVDKYGSKWTQPDHLVVTGPYKLAEWKRDQHYLLKRNPLYYGKAGFEETLKAIVVSADATALSLFQNKTLDWVHDVPFLEKPRLSAMPEYKIYEAYIGYHLGFKHDATGALTRDQRCALSYAIDKNKIGQLLRGGETPAWSVSHPTMSALKPRPVFDAARARKLWAGRDGELDVHFYSKDIHTPLMEFVQQEWKKNLGITVKLQRTDGKVYWSRLHKEPPPVFLSGTTAAYNHPYSFLSEFLSESHANWGRYKSASYDNVALKTTTLAAGPALTRAVKQTESQILSHDCAVIPLYFRKTAALVSSKWTGFHVNPLSRIYLKNVRAKH